MSVKLTCDDCNEEFSSKRRYETHIKRHKRNMFQKNKTYLCNICGRNFANYNSWIGHARIHTGEKPYHCDICGKNFRQTTSLRNHKQLHTGKRVSCELCPKKFASTGFLAIHMRSHNSKFSNQIHIRNFFKFFLLFQMIDRLIVSFVIKVI